MTTEQKIRASKSEMFHTPKNWDALADWIESHPPTDRAQLWTVAGMAWNLALESAAERVKFDQTPEPTKQDVFGREFV